MDISKINQIRETIKLAQKHESQTAHLAGILRNSVDQLHRSIELPGDDSVSTLLDFVVQYIKHVPDFVEAISTLTNDAGIFDYTSTFVGIAQDYFLKPPEMVADHTGLDALMDEAYLAHRLMEEINDRFIGRCGIPLAPMDMTRSNIIIHHLIGEPFANELDMAVQYSVELLMNKERVFREQAFLDYVEEHKKRGWSDELKRWPCLAKDLAIALNFSRDDQAAIEPNNHLH